MRNVLCAVRSIFSEEKKVSAADPIEIYRAAVDGFCEFAFEQRVESEPRHEHSDLRAIFRRNIRKLCRPGTWHVLHHIVRRARQVLRKVERERAGIDIVTTARTRRAARGTRRKSATPAETPLSVPTLPRVRIVNVARGVAP
jgi:hypothetical protein